MTAFTWSTTAANNDTADATINWQEGQSPKTVNNSGRAMMAALAKYFADQSGNLETGGTSTAYTVTTNQQFTSLSDGLSIWVKFDQTNGASPTFSPDSLTAKALQAPAGTAIATGFIDADIPYKLTYDATADAWIVANGNLDTAVSAFLDGSFMPNGTLALFVQTTAPTGWTKDTNYNEHALRVVSGTASNGGSTNFTSVLTSRTLTVAQLPSHSHSVTDPGHVHTYMDHDDGLHPSGTTTTEPRGNRDTEFSVDSATTGITIGNTGSGDAIDFAVKYKDCIIATKDAY